MESMKHLLLNGDYSTLESVIQVLNANNLTSAVVVLTPALRKAQERFDKQAEEQRNEREANHADEARIKLERNEERRLSRKKRYYDFDNQYEEMKDLLATNEAI